MNRESGEYSSLNRPMRVLVVEDESRLREVLVRAIPDMGFDVGEVARGSDALEVFEQATPDIVILDLHLPDMDGIDLFESTRKKWPETQFIILTGFGSLEAAKQAIRLDVVDFLTKPASLGELEFALDRARRRRMGNLELPQDEERASREVDRHLDPTSLQTLADFERHKILEALGRHNGNRAATAKELGISLRTLYYRLADYEKQGLKVDGR